MLFEQRVNPQDGQISLWTVRCELFARSRCSLLCLKWFFFPATAILIGMIRDDIYNEFNHWILGHPIFRQTLYVLP